MTEPGDLLSIQRFIADPEQWSFRRLTAGPMSYNHKPGGLHVNPESLGVRYAEVPQPFGWRFASLPTPTSSPMSRDFVRFDERSVVAPNDAVVSAWLDAGWAGRCAIAEELESASGPWAATLRTELPHWNKLTVQRGTLPWYFIHAPGPGRRGLTIPAAYIDTLRSLIQRYAAAYTPIPGKPDPADTNSGWPNLVTHPVAKVVSCMIAGNDADAHAFLDLGRKFALTTNLSAASAWGFGLGNRTGPSYKQRDILRHTGGANFSVWGDGIGFAERNRIIYMASAAANRLLRPLYERLQGARRNLPGLWHAGGVSFRPLASYPYQYEADISGFDASVTPELQDVLAHAMARAWPDLLQLIKLWRIIEELPFITPSWSFTPGRCALIQALGGTRSGIKTTAEAGTLYARAATEYALRRQGWAPTDCAILSLGDDIRLGTSQPLDPALWSSSFADVGLACNLLEGDGFLARHLSPTLDGVPIAGRIVQQTMSNERERFGEPALGITYLGFLARTERVQSLPPFLKNLSWTVIRHAAWIQKLCHQHAISSLDELRTLIEHDATIRITMIDALRSVEGTAWYTEHERAAEHSPVGKELLMYVSRALTEYRAERATLQHLIDAASNRLCALPTPQRLRLAAEGYFSVTHGSLQAWKWLAYANH
jgi:hypothetical protein